VGAAKGGPIWGVIMAIAIQRALGMILTRHGLRTKRRFIQARLHNPDFTLGFDQPINRDWDSRELNLYALPDPPKTGRAIFAAQTVRAINIARSRSPDIRGALAGGVSRRKDPQFIIPLPEHARSAGTELLEFDLYASRAGTAHIFWLRGDEFCVSISFRVHAGRRRYLLDLWTIGVVSQFGDPSLRSSPIDSLRIDPSGDNGVTLGLFGARLLERGDDTVSSPDVYARESGQENGELQIGDCKLQIAN
jgi:hypothetical protein